MSCDNLQENGFVARKAFTSFALAVDPTLAEWMAKHVSFPNSMVDRITPATTEEDRMATTKKLGIVDSWPVVCEPFFQWVLEDKFVAGRPPFEDAGVQLVKDVEPYELMKLRLLNASHQSIAYFGLLLDYELVHEVTQDDLVTNFMKAYLDREATSTLKPLAGIDVAEYKAKVLERFQNPNVRDTLARLAMDGSDRITNFVMPVIIDRLAKGESIWQSTAIVVSFARCLEGKSDSGKKINVVDRSKEKLSHFTNSLRTDSKAIRGEHEVFGDLVNDEQFIKVFQIIYDKLHKDGSKETLLWLMAQK